MTPPQTADLPPSGRTQDLYLRNQPRTSPAAGAARDSTKTGS